MACCNCNCNPCNCTPANCGTPACECVDPGIITAGRFLSVKDYRFCDRRLQNLPGVLVNQTTGSGAANIRWTTDPCIPSTELELEDGDKFSHLVAALGDSGCYRRLVPEASANGYLRATNGQWELGDLPSSTVPDPLTLQQLIVQNSATINDLTVGDALTFTALATGTITATVGLDAGGNLVQQTSGSSALSLKAACYYESSSATATSTPNIAINANDYAIIGNELFDPDNLGTITNQFTIRVDVTGKYVLVWMGFFEGQASAGSPSLHLEINGIPAAFPNGRSATMSGSSNVFFPFIGFHPVSLNQSDLIKLLVNSTAKATGNKLRDVKLLLFKFQ